MASSWARWIVAVMAPFPYMRFPSDWTAYDEEDDAVVIEINNLLDHPSDPNGRVDRSWREVRLDRVPRAERVLDQTPDLTG